MAKAPQPTRKTADRTSSDRPSPIDVSRKPPSWCVRRKASAVALLPAQNADPVGARVSASCGAAPVDRGDVRDDRSAPAPTLRGFGRERSESASALFPPLDRAG